jgi:muramoyltetrapeptide carboxypeptidase
MTKPPALRPPALVGVLAPSSPVRKVFVDAGVAELERLGFRVRLGEHLYQRGRYTAGSVEARLQDWTALWEDPDVSGVFCARGGYGSMELLSRIPVEPIRACPKVLIGASDVTALHCLLASRVALACFHGPMLAQQIARGFYDSGNLLKVVGSSTAYGRYDVASVELLHGGASEGPLLGGCLSMVASLVGTPYLPSFRDAVVFLEDTQTKPYQIDRMLTQLRLAGALDGVRGLVFGEMPGCEQHPDQGYTLQEMLRDWTEDLHIPVLFGFPSGHTVSPALTIPLGARARVDSEGLSILEGAVA